MPRVETQPHSAPACTRSPASPHAALLFKVAVVWLTLFLKPIPVLELSSTRPAVTTKNVCRVTATSEEVGGGRRPRMGPQSGWIKKKKKTKTSTVRKKQKMGVGGFPFSSFSTPCLQAPRGTAGGLMAAGATWLR